MTFPLILKVVKQNNKQAIKVPHTSYSPPFFVNVLNFFSCSPGLYSKFKIEIES